MMDFVTNIKFHLKKLVYVRFYKYILAHLIENKISIYLLLTAEAALIKKCNGQWQSCTMGTMHGETNQLVLNCKKMNRNEWIDPKKTMLS